MNISVAKSVTSLRTGDADVPVSIVLLENRFYLEACIINAKIYC